VQHHIGGLARIQRPILRIYQAKDTCRYTPAARPGGELVKTITDCLQG
jgi:hypothetical protein